MQFSLNPYKQTLSRAFCLSVAVVCLGASNSAWALFSDDEARKAILDLRKSLATTQLEMQSQIDKLKADNAAELSGWAFVGSNSKDQSVFVKVTQPQRTTGYNGATQYQILQPATIDFRIGTVIAENELNTAAGAVKLPSVIDFRKSIDESLNGLIIPGGTIQVKVGEAKIFDLQDQNKFILREFSINPAQLDVSVVEAILSGLTK